MLLRHYGIGAVRRVCRRSRRLSPASRLCRASSATSAGLLPAALLRAAVLLRRVLLPAFHSAPVPILCRVSVLARPALRLLRAASVLGQALGRPPSLVGAIHGTPQSR